MLCARQLLAAIEQARISAKRSASSRLKAKASSKFSFFKKGEGSKEEEESKKQVEALSHGRSVKEY